MNILVVRLTISPLRKPTERFFKVGGPNHQVPVAEGIPATARDL